ncbi:Asp23/Gls24 family envelope stress response protein [Leifsonia aquatica]|uniref:Asp23/Gls24 family envelope stress response protein n=1 Tax=Leifsonia aquatica TaxID=144185 RepID=UPI0005B8CB28|nr:Asp23/Gls24 family envelope stress response protein [Leifsonia aquatica]
MTDPLLPEDEMIDGHTLDELSDYLARGRTPADASIDGSAECRAALEALERLSRTTRTMLEADAASRPTDDGWVGRILDGIRLDVQAGRRIPVAHPDPAADLALTEGAVRALIRSVGDAIYGLIVVRTRIVGDVETLGAPIQLHVEISVRYGEPFGEVAARMRSAVVEELSRHVELTVGAVDVTVTDVWDPDRDGGGA